MALRLKTIEFAISTNGTSLASGTKRTLTGSTQIFIPESTITFKSCVLEFVVSSNATTANNLTSPTLGFSLGAIAETSVVLSNPNANSASGEVWQFSRDVTAYFANWTGTAMNWYASFTGTGIATNNHAAKIIITYQYEESTSNTQIKTIRIPIESTRALLTSSYQTVGGAIAIPPLKGTYLPETGITIRQMYLDIQGNDGMTSNTNFSGSTRINGGTSFAFWTVGIGALNSSRWCHSFYDFTSLNLTGSTNYSLEMISSTTNRFPLIGGMIVCTYEYNVTGSTTIYNSLILGGASNSGWIGGTTSADQNSWQKEFYIEEPANITIKESAVGLYFYDNIGFSLSVGATGYTSGQTTSTTYTVNTATLECGQFSLFHRVDAGGQNGRGLYLTRGKNVYRLNYFSNTINAGWNLSGCLILNYTSGKYSGGVGAHAHSCFQYVASGATVSRVQTSNTLVACPIPETYYNLIDYVSYVACTVGVAVDSAAYTLNTEILANEKYNDGWVSIYNGMGPTDAKNTNETMFGCGSNLFARWNGDPDTNRLNILSARRYRLDTDPLNYAYFGYYYTYNNLTYSISGVCNNFIGDGSGIPISIYRIVSGNYDDLILNLTTTTGGIFSGTWIDNTDSLYATARQSSTLLGRSANGTAS